MAQHPTVCNRNCRKNPHQNGYSGRAILSLASWVFKVIAHQLTQKWGAPALTSPLNRDGLFAYLDELGIATKTVAHEPVFSVSESQDVERALPGGHTKNLFLKSAKGELLLVIAHADTQVDLKALPKRVGCARLSFAKADVLREVLGVTPGSVTGFALVNDTEPRVKVILDQDLMQFDSINCHPLENNATTNIARDDFLKFLLATGHAPETIDLGPSKIV